jgi:glucosamine--fructose-6-phosphate aminotransferase (isomerizing)
VIVFATGEDGDLFRAPHAILQQLKARGATVMVVACQEDVDDLRSLSDDLVAVPKVSQWVQMIVNIVPMQLLNYFVATLKRVNVDRPRNLAKSVTVI